MSIFNFFFRNKVNKENEKKGEQYFRQALSYCQYGNNEEAINFFNKSLEVSPYHAAVHLNRGGCFMVQERYLEAMEDFDKVINMEKEGISLDRENVSSLASKNASRIAPFVIFENEKGIEIRKMLTNDGLEHFSTRWSEVIYSDFLKNNQSAAFQFVCEELKELEEMGGMHREYALNCDVEYTVYSNVDTRHDTHSAFMFFKGILCCFSRNPNQMLEVRKNILNKLLIISNSEYCKASKSTSGARMHLPESGAEIMFIVKNRSIIYINKMVDDLFEEDSDGDFKLDGRITNFKFFNENEMIEIFVAFNDEDSYMMFTANVGRDDRLNFVAREIFSHIMRNNVCKVFSETGNYSSQYHYAFRLYRRGNVNYMVNNSRTQAYLITEEYFKEGDADSISDEFSKVRNDFIANKI
ncbi:TPA: tetratricopeptide repeat protein [Vibrio harveyi]|uniref:tetratricopeptide repeat protein n=1 Tax=Vibrio harveyi TaxID=669 RepID=UPI0030FA47C0